MQPARPVSSSRKGRIARDTAPRLRMVPEARRIFFSKRTPSFSFHSLIMPPTIGLWSAGSFPIDLRAESASPCAPAIAILACSRLRAPETPRSPAKPPPRAGLLILCRVSLHSSKSFLGDFCEFRESFRVVDRYLGEHLPVDLDIGLLQSIDEPAVAQSVNPGRCVDPGDPELPEISLACPTVSDTRMTWPCQQLRGRTCTDFRARQ